MRFMRQLGVILLVSAAGEMLRGLLPFPIPAGIYGFAIMFVCLCTGVIKLDHVEDAGDGLVDVMQVLLIPACVEVMSFWDELRSVLPALIAASVVSTLAVLAATGKVSDIVIDAEERLKR